MSTVRTHVALGESARKSGHSRTRFRALRCEPLEERRLLSVDLIRDINVTGASSSPNSITDVNGTVFFSASDPATGTELWKSDGTTAGTVLVKDIRPGTLSGDPGRLVNVAGTLYFSAAAEQTRFRDLWSGLSRFSVAISG